MKPNDEAKLGAVINMFEDDDTPLSFADETQTSGEGSPAASPWKILIVDDEPEVHSVTKLALAGFEFADRGLEFVSAHSAGEAKLVLSEHPDVSVMFVDVVMETDDAGLQFVRYVRDELGNRMTRIVLRTGQPGQAPEVEVIAGYDINDYKEKTELTAKKLQTSMYSALRGYRDLSAIALAREGVETVLNATTQILQPQALNGLAAGVLRQIEALL